MSAERDSMIEALKKHVVPELRARGFKGSFPHFRRPAGSLIHILSFQFSSWGGGFVVEIGACPSTGVELHTGEHIPPSKVCHRHVFPRLRLGSSERQVDHWFYYDERADSRGEEVYQVAARSVLSHLEQAQAWWRDYEKQKSMA